MLDGRHAQQRAHPTAASRTPVPPQEGTTVKAARLSAATTRGIVRVLAPAAVVVLLTGLTACGSSSGADSGAGTSSAAGSTPAAGSPTTAPVAQGPIGGGCGVFAAEGPGSLAAVATAPVGGAVSTVPQLSTLTQAVIAANLVDVVNTREDVTVLAPSNAAFDALGPAALPALLADVPRLTAVLTHHVLPGRLGPDQLVGEHTTLNGDTVTVAGPAAAPTVAADQTVAAVAQAAVVCGNVPTANATVYVIDQVLAPAG
jgi:uncharacterized surface protein with fasciclin (FAS1) repeats